MHTSKNSQIFTFVVSIMKKILQSHESSYFKHLREKLPSSTSFEPLVQTISNFLINLFMHIANIRLIFTLFVSITKNLLQNSASSNLKHLREKLWSSIFSEPPAQTSSKFQINFLCIFLKSGQFLQCLCQSKKRYCRVMQAPILSIWGKSFKD
jgi:hypothetical protein